MYRVQYVQMFNMYSRYSMHSMYSKYVCTYVRVYVCTYVLMHLVPSTVYASICIRMHPCPFICIRHASVCTPTPPYASITHSNVNMPYTFSQTNQKVTRNRRRNITAIGNDDFCANPTRYTKNGQTHINEKGQYGSN